MFLNRKEVDDIEDDHKFLHLCVPGTQPGPSSMSNYDSASPFFNYSIDCSLGIDSLHGKISVDINFTENCDSICTCRGNGICRYCLPVEPSSSSLTVGPVSLRFSSSARRRNAHNNGRVENKLTVLRGVVKTPKFYRTTKVRNLNETLLFSLSRSRNQIYHQSAPRNLCHRASLQNKERDAKYRSKIPISSAIAAMLNLDKRKTDADNLKEAIEEFNSLHFGSQLRELEPIPEETNVVALSESLSSAAITFSKDYVEDLCTRIHALPLQESNVAEDLFTVNSLLPKIESFSMSSEDQSSV